MTNAEEYCVIVSKAPGEQLLSGTCVETVMLVIVILMQSLFSIFICLSQESYKGCVFVTLKCLSARNCPSVTAERLSAMAVVVLRNTAKMCWMDSPILVCVQFD